MTDRIPPLLRMYIWLLMAVTSLPIVVVIGASFNEGMAIMFPPKGLTLHWYREALGNAEVLRTAWNSLVVAIGCTLTAIVIGVPAAIALVRHVKKRRELLQSILLSPLTVPSIVVGMAFLAFFTQTGIGLNLPSLIIAHTVVTLPYIIRSVASIYLSVESTVEEAAASLGGSPWQVFWHVTAPLIRPGIVAGAIFAFIMSFDNVSVSIFITKNDTLTLPIYMMSYLVYNFDPSIAAISVIRTALTALLLLFLEKAYGAARMLV